MPDDFSLLASQGNNLCFINDRVLILGREVCVVFYPVKVVFEFQNNIFASLNAIFESFVHIRTIKKIDDINYSRFISDSIHLQCMFIDTAQDTICVIDLNTHWQTSINTFCKQKLIFC